MDELKNLLSRVHNAEALELMERIPPGFVDAIITDLPYGTTEAKWDIVIPFEPMWKAVQRILKPNGVFVTTAAQPFSSLLVVSNVSRFRCEWIYEKTSASGFLNAKKQPLRIHEHILVFYSGSPTYNPQMRAGEPYARRAGKPISVLWGKQAKRSAVETISNGKRYPTTILKFDNHNSLGGKLNPTQKPEALFRYLIKTYTNPGDIVLDFCCGSGTTGVAAQQTGRRWILGDGDPDAVLMSRIRLGLQ